MGSTAGDLIVQLSVRNILDRHPCEGSLSIMVLPTQDALDSFMELLREVFQGAEVFTQKADVRNSWLYSFAYAGGRPLLRCFSALLSCYIRWNRDVQQSLQELFFPSSTALTQRLIFICWCGNSEVYLGHWFWPQLRNFSKKYYNAVLASAIMCFNLGNHWIRQFLAQSYLIGLRFNVINTLDQK